MNKVQSVVFAAAFALLANVALATDGLGPATKAEKYAGVVTLKVGNKVNAYALTEEHKDVLAKAKAVAEEVAAGKMKEDSDDAQAIEKQVREIVASKKGVTFVASSYDRSNLEGVTEQSVKATCGWGWNRGWGFCGPSFVTGVWAPVCVTPVVPVCQPFFTYSTVNFGFWGGFGGCGFWF